MNKRMNLTFVLCSDYDEIQRNVSGIQNEVYAHEKEVSLKFLILINGILQEEKKRRYDFVLKCIDSSQDLNGAVRHLFTFNLSPDEKQEEKEKKRKSSFSGVISEIAFANINIKLPCEGLFEIQAYEVEDDDEENARERLRKRLNDPNEMIPYAVYPLRVIFD